ncbi:MAG: FAD-dependent oxidoreductase, partial [Leptospiraceae bacterium]|nr:FAD-dependent oxidoreductase [Leptospiraceae bacterium]
MKELSTQIYDVAVFGAGISGFSSALRLQKKGLSTIVFESHTQVGGCAGYFIKKKFSFDVGATTLVDFVEGGVGGNFLKEIGLAIPEGEYLDYIAWLPDRQVVLYKDKEKWNRERLEKFGKSDNYIQFWKLMDRVTDVFWEASRKNIKLPIRNINEFLHTIQVIGLKNLHFLKYYNTTMLDILKKFNLEKDKALIGLLSMLIEDTIHSKIEKAPFINSSLGTTIRGAGLMRARGGMKGFWKNLSEHYLNLGGIVKKLHKVTSFCKEGDCWKITTDRGNFFAKKIISSLPLDVTYDLAPDFIQTKVKPYILKNKEDRGGAIVIFLGVPEEEVRDHTITHHQMLLDYDAELGNGNNMFISISSKDDNLSAPPGYRSVMISTHCELSDWQGLSEEEYRVKKQQIGDTMIHYARRVYPKLATNPVVLEVGTPITYQKFTNRKEGSVGGFKQTFANTNFHAVPQ